MQVTADKNKYLAFVLNEATRQKLIDALGERFRVRVCHHITLAHDVLPDAVNGLQRLIDSVHNNFIAIGAYITGDYATISVFHEYKLVGTPTERNHLFKHTGTNMQPNGVKKLHITYERKEHISNRECVEVLNMTTPFTFIPLHFKLEGEFQMLEKGGNTPEEVNENFALTPKVNIKGEDWVPCGWTPEGHPMSFVLRNKNGPSRTVDMDLTPHSEYMKLYVVWKTSEQLADRMKSMHQRIHERRRGAFHKTFSTRLVSPPQPVEVDPNHQGLCCEVRDPGELTPCVSGKSDLDNLCKPMAKPAFVWAEIRQNGFGIKSVVSEEGFYGTKFTADNYPIQFALRRKGKDVETIFGDHEQFDALFRDWCLANNRPIPEGYDVKKWFPQQRMASGPADAEQCQHDQWKPARDCL